MTKKKKTGSNNPLPIGQPSPGKPRPVAPNHETLQPQSCLGWLRQHAKTLGTIVLKTFRGILEASAILGILGFYYQFSPNLSVTPHQGFAASDPFRTPFVISNNSYIDFRNVRTDCLLMNVEHSGNINIKTSQIGAVGEAKLVPAGESLTVRCDLEQFFNAFGLLTPRDLLSADIKIDVIFEIFPYRYIRKEERTFRFVAAKADDSHWYWIPQPIGKSK